MQVSIEADRSHVEQLEQLIAMDRSSAGESRRGQAQGPLHTAEYNVPLRVMLKQRWREERRACVAMLAVVAAISALLGFYLFTPSSKALSNTHVARPIAPRPVQPARAPLRAASRPAAALRSVAAPGPTNAADAGPSTPATPSLSVQLRLQRADLWLRIGTQRAAQEARRLLESALAERPGSAHGQAALAQACLILEDQRCARDAIQQAQRVRPWRGGYRVLSRHIERTFDTQP